jgi:exonuclease III
MALIITLNVNVNSLFKRHRLSKFFQKTKQNKKPPTICCVQESHFTTKGVHWLKVRVWNKIYHGNGIQKKEGIDKMLKHLNI